MSRLLTRLEKELARIKPATILIVEPDNTIAKLLCDHLENYTTDVTSNGRDALAYCQETPPSLILLDSNLPDMDALALFQQLLPIKFINNVPVFMLGQRFDTRDQRMKALDLGIDDYIHKPFDIIELQFRIKNALPDPASSPDLVTGLPNWPASHRAIEKQLKQTETDWQLILLATNQLDAYLDLHGTIAGQRVRRTLADMLNDTVDKWGNLDDFIGVIGEGNFIILTKSGNAAQMESELGHLFKTAMRDWYSTEEIAVNGIQFPDGRRAPLMSLITAVVDGQSQPFTHSLDLIAAAEALQQAKQPTANQQSEKQTPPLKAIFATS